MDPQCGYKLPCDKEIAQCEAQCCVALDEARRSEVFTDIYSAQVDCEEDKKKYLPMDGYANQTAHESGSSAILKAPSCSPSCDLENKVS